MPNTTYARSQGRNRFGRRNYGKYVTKGYLKAIVGVPESKWINTSLAPTAAAPNIVTTGTQQPVVLNAIPQGTTQSTRIGNEVSNKSLHIRLDIARAAVDSLLRVIVFWNLDGFGSATLVSSLLENNTAGQAYQSPLNKDFGKTFWVKFDKTYAIAAGQTQLVVDEIWRKLKCKTEYINDDSSNSSANSLHIAFISNQITPANQPLFSFTSRLTYLDV